MIHTGDCITVMATFTDASVDAVVTDPPYGLGFMGKDWDNAARMASVPPSVAKRIEDGSDVGRLGNYPGGKGQAAVAFNGRAYQAWCTEWATEAFRVLKPGGYLLAFGGTRTVHRLASAIEDAGFEIRDELVWIYASGFPKSLDVGKAMDRAAGAERAERVDPRWAERYPNGNGGNHNRGPDGIYGAAESVLGRKLTTSDPATDLARQWDGWGTALKPAHEPIVMARKPLVGTVAGNVAKYGTGALNIDGTRLTTTELKPYSPGLHRDSPSSFNDDAWQGREEVKSAPAGRWPSNILLSDPELFDEPNPYVVGSGATSDSHDTTPGGQFIERNAESLYELGHKQTKRPAGRGDSGGYSRFFIVPKADRADREPVLRGQLGVRDAGTFDGNADHSEGAARKIEARPDLPVRQRGNVHPTVKPTDLMRHLVRLVTPPGGTVLDPFLGSGSTAIACELEGFPWIGIEKEPEYVAIAEARLNGTQRGLGLDVPAPTRRDMGKQRGNKDAQGWPSLGSKRSPADNWSGGWTGSDEETA